MSQFSETIEDTGLDLIKSAQQFIKNEDYRKFALINKTWAKDENGNKTYKEEVQIIETSMIRINEVKKAVDIISRVVKLMEQINQDIDGTPVKQAHENDLKTAVTIKKQMSKYVNKSQSTPKQAAISSNILFSKPDIHYTAPYDFKTASSLSSGEALLGIPRITDPRQLKSRKLCLK